MNDGGQFKYKVGQRVTVRWETVKARYDWSTTRVVITDDEITVLGRVKARTIEPALGKTYLVTAQNGRSLGYIPESRLTPR